ncbi:DUF6282 family protein [Amycolatopsis thermoflava]
MDGAIDLHVHYGPEPLTDLATGESHSVTPIAAAREAESMGFGAIVLKPHEFPSTVLAALAGEAAPHLQVFAGIVCDFPVGGLNPAAVEVALRSGAKIVWLPTFSSHTTSHQRKMRMWGRDRGISVLDDEGRLLTEVREIMDLVAESGAILATGHVGHHEQFEVAREFGKRGKVVITHAMQSAADGGAGPGLSSAQCRELAELGATIEFSARMCFGAPAAEATVAKAIDEVGTGSVVLSSDYGWNRKMPNPAPGLKNYIDRLWELGVPESSLRTLVVDNAARLLSMDPR